MKEDEPRKASTQKDPDSFLRSQPKRKTSVNKSTIKTTEEPDKSGNTDENYFSSKDVTGNIVGMTGRPV